MLSDDGWKLAHAHTSEKAVDVVQARPIRLCTAGWGHDDSHPRSIVGNCSRSILPPSGIPFPAYYQIFSHPLFGILQGWKFQQTTGTLTWTLPFVAGYTDGVVWEGQ